MYQMLKYAKNSMHIHLTVSNLDFKPFTSSLKKACHTLQVSVNTHKMDGYEREEVAMATDDHVGKLYYKSHDLLSLL